MEIKQASKARICGTLPEHVTDSKILYISRKLSDSRKKNTSSAVKQEDVTSQQVSPLQSPEGRAVNWGRITQCVPCLSAPSQAACVSHFQGKTNELDGPLAWFNTSVLTFFIIHLGWVDCLFDWFNLSTVSQRNCAKRTNCCIHDNVAGKEINSAGQHFRTDKVLAWQSWRGVSERGTQGVLLCE